MLGAMTNAPGPAQKPCGVSAFHVAANLPKTLDDGLATGGRLEPQEQHGVGCRHRLHRQQRDQVRSCRHEHHPRGWPDASQVELAHRRAGRASLGQDALQPLLQRDVRGRARRRELHVYRDAIQALLAAVEAQRGR
jgi:hypothetical protein